MPRQKKRVYRSRVVRRQVKVSFFERFGASKLGIFIAGFFILLLSVAIFHTWSHVQVVNVGYNIDKELKVKDQLIQENKILKLKVAKLRSLTRIETLAREKLGMQMPQKKQMVFLSQLQEFEFDSSEHPQKDPDKKTNEEIKVADQKKTSKTKQLSKNNNKVVAKSSTSKKKTVEKKKSNKQLVAKQVLDEKRKKVRPASIIKTAKR